MMKKDGKVVDCSREVSSSLVGQYRRNPLSNNIFRLFHLISLFAIGFVALIQQFHPLSAYKSAGQPSL
jgi:hypothetical protein